MLQIKYVYTQSEQPIKHPGFLFKIGANSLYFQAASLCCCSWTAPIVVQQKKKKGKHKPWDLALPHNAFNHATKLVLTSGCQFQEVAEQSSTDTSRTSEICRGRSDFQNHHLTSSSEEEEEEDFFCVLLSNAVGMTSGIWTTCVFGLVSTGFNLSAWQFPCVQTWSY